MSKRIVVGITGSIAAYKGLEVIRGFKKRGEKVIGVLTPEAKEFITPLSVSTLSGNPVVVDFFTPKTTPVHLELSKSEIILVVPATYNFINKIATGIADDPLSCAIAASSSTVIFAPCMETRMWENEILQQNIKKLKKLGYHFIEPEVGELSTLKIGKGRLPTPEVIIRKVYQIVKGEGKFSGKRVIVTAGRSEEDIDPVRCITNRASGKLGCAIAEEIAREGGEVVLILGPSGVSVEEYLKVISVRTIEEFMTIIFKELELGCDLLVMSAAIGNYTPVTKYKQKLKSPELELKFRRTQDVLKKVRKNYPKLPIVGFALETENYIENGKKKLEEKKLNLIIVNTPKVMGGEFFKGWIIDRKGEIQEVKEKLKEEAAKEIVEKIHLLIKEKKREERV